MNRPLDTRRPVADIRADFEMLSAGADSETLLTRARKLLSEGDDPGALRLYTAMLEKYGEGSAAVYEGAVQAFRNMGYLDHALNTVDAGLRFFPGHSSLTYIRSLLLLGLGHYREGWPGYELRLKTAQACYRPRRVTWQQWRGEPLAGKSILLWGDQGLGDEIMFASIVPDLVKLGARVTLECSRELRALFARSFPFVEVVPHDFNGSMPVELDGRNFDYECALGSLAQWTRQREWDFPGKAYLIEPRRIADNSRFFLTHLVRKAPKKIIGLSWRGGTIATRRAARSLDLEHLKILAPFKNCLFVNLQHDCDIEEMIQFRAILSNSYSDIQALNSLETTAAMISACDCVLSVCGTVVHLAGALGKRVNVLAPFAPEWRYGFSGTKMPWYPDVHVYRQRRYGDWSGALENAVAVSVACKTVRQ